MAAAKRKVDPEQVVRELSKEELEEIESLVATAEATELEEAKRGEAAQELDEVEYGCVICDHCKSVGWGKLECRRYPVPKPIDTLSYKCGEYRRA
jgi:hypothetical protein